MLRLLARRRVKFWSAARQDESVRVVQEVPESQIPEFYRLWDRACQEGTYGARYAFWRFVITQMPDLPTGHMFVDTSSILEPSVICYPAEDPDEEEIECR